MSLGEIQSIGAYEAKTHFSELLERVEAGQEFTITKHGSPVARLLPLKKISTSQERREAIAKWTASSQRPSLGDLSVRDLINEGRR